MAKMSLTAYMNSELKLKGLGVKEAKKDAGKYKSIGAAKKAGSLYYTDKKGKIMAAVYAEDLNKKPAAAPTESKITKTKLKPGQKGDLISDRHEGSGPASKNNPMARVKKISQQASNDVMAQASYNNLSRDEQKTVQNMVNSAGMTRNNAIAKVTANKTLDKKNQVTKGNNKGGMMMKKKGYAEGGMPMTMKAGKKVPTFAADGVGKMNKGGAVKKKPTAKMMAGGMAAKKKPAAKMMGGGMAKKKPAAKMMGGGMTKKSSGYMYGGMVKKPAAKKK